MCAQPTIPRGVRAASWEAAEAPAAAPMPVPQPLSGLAPPVAGKHPALLPPSSLA